MLEAHQFGRSAGGKPKVKLMSICVLEETVASSIQMSEVKRKRDHWH